MSPKVSEEHVEQRRHQILDAAVACFSRYGLHKATLDHIQREAGLSRGAVYHYFKSKKDLTEGIRQRSSVETNAVVAESGVEGTERLRELLEASYANLADPESVDANRLALMLWAEALVDQSVMDGQMPSFRPFLDALSESVKEAQQRGELNSHLEPEAVARIVSGALIGLQVQLTWEPDIDMDSAKQALVAMLTGGFSRDETRIKSSSKATS
jgi:AcrR family transcriptional regulator